MDRLTQWTGGDRELNSIKLKLARLNEFRSSLSPKWGQTFNLEASNEFLNLQIDESGQYRQ